MEGAQTWSSPHPIRVAGSPPLHRRADVDHAHGGTAFAALGRHAPPDAASTAREKCVPPQPVTPRAVHDEPAVTGWFGTPQGWVQAGSLK
jgi:hypothetical protein